MQTVVDKQKLLNWVQNIGISEEFKLFYSKLLIPKDLKFKTMDFSAIQKMCCKVNGENKKSINKIDLKTSPNEILWRIGEYKLFIWISSLYMHSHRFSINNMIEKDYQFLNDIFLQQNTLILRHQLLSIYASKAMLKKQWDQSELQLLKEILNKRNQMEEQISWKQVSFELYIYSNKQYFRTNTKCREMWNNHLRPNLNKKTWTTQEDLLLFSTLKEQNRCWANIAKRFEGTRNEHMIKNRYKKLMNNSRSKDQHLSKKQIQKNILRYLTCKYKKDRCNSIKTAQQSQRKNQHFEEPENDNIMTYQPVTEQKEMKLESTIKLQPHPNPMQIQDQYWFPHYTLEKGQIKFEDVCECKPRKLFDQGLWEMLGQSRILFIEDSFYEPQQFLFQLQQ